MKKQIFFTLFVIFLSFGCKKDISSEQQTLPTTTTTSSVDEKQMVKDQAESIGKTAYRYLKFYFTQKKPEDYLNPAIRKPIMENLTKAQAEYKGLSVEQTIQKAESNQIITEKMASSLRNLVTLNASLSDVTTIEEIETRYKNFEETVYANKELTNDEKICASSISASIRSVMRFEGEMEKGRFIVNSANQGIQLRETCLFGRKADCFGNAFVKAGIAGITAAVRTIVTGAAGVATATVAAVIVGVIGGILEIYADNSCKCGETSGCFQVKVINPVLNSNSACSPYVGFVVSGTGTVPPIFTWSAFRFVNGFEIPIPEVQNKTTLGPALPPFPIDPNEEIRLQVIPGICNGNQEPGTKYIFKLNDLLGDPGSVIISGPSQVWLNTTGTFRISGDCLFNPYNQYSWQNPSAGQVISGGNTTEATIKFTMRTCYSSGGWSSSCFPVYVIGNSINPCSMLQTGNAKSVTVP
jgi:hypothetical protein